MKLAYLISLYPAVSHTFILREVQALRALGFDIGMFSVRKPGPEQLLGPAAEQEYERTRWLLPAHAASYVWAFVWALLTRPLLFFRTLREAVLWPGLGLRLRFMWLMYFVEAVQLAYWVVRESYEHVHVHFGNPGSNTAYLAARIAGRPFSMTLHGIDLDEPEKFRLARKADLAKFVVCISEYGRSRLMSITPQENWSKVHVVRNGIPLPEANAIAPLPHNNGIICVARLSKEKGHMVLLEALLMLKASGVEFCCTLVGDGPLRRKSEAQTRELGLDEWVHFAGALPPAAVVEEYNRADVCVLASFGEGIPLTLTEALAYGRPVVATSVGGVPELVEPGVTGYLVPPNSPSQLADALKRVLEQPELARKMGERGRERVRKDYNVERATARLAALFQGHGPQYT